MKSEKFWEVLGSGGGWTGGGNDVRAGAREKYADGKELRVPPN